MTLKQKLIWGLHRAISRLPFCVLYGISNVLYYLVYYVVRYRKRVVRDNLSSSFPEKSTEELRRIEKDFFSFFCDYIVETLKLFSMSEQEIKKRMTFTGFDQLKDETQGNDVVFLMISHYCNWEYFTSIPLWYKDENAAPGTLYQPLNNKTYDSIFLRMRERMGLNGIASKEILRKIIGNKRAGKRSAIGFISDQSPTGKGAHSWHQFLNHDTAFYAGAATLGKKFNGAFYFADMHRVKRGHYHCDVVRMDTEGKSEEEIIGMYAAMAEKMIRRDPPYWLWSHKRFKRDRSYYRD